MVTYSTWTSEDAKAFLNGAGRKENLEESPNLYERLRYVAEADIYAPPPAFHCFVAARDANRLVGWCTLTENPYKQREFWMTGIAVDVGYRNRGIAKELLDRAADVTLSSGKDLVFSSYTFFGKEFLERSINSLTGKFPGLLVVPPDGCFGPNDRDAAEAKIMGFSHPSLSPDIDI